jgi:hypothetical protein
MSNQSQSSSPTSTSSGNGLSIASLVLGILTLCSAAGSIIRFASVCSGLFGIIGVVLGVLGLNTKGRSMAIAGIILSAAGLILLFLVRVIFRGIFLDHLIQQYLLRH